MKRFSKSFVSIFLTIVVVISILPMSAFAASYSVNYWEHSVPGRTLSNGCKGDDVKWLQCAINNLVTNGDRSNSRLSTSKLDVDGDFGNATKTAVLAFQKKYGLAVDGYFGPASLAKMKSVVRYGVIPFDPVDKNITEGVYYIRNKLTGKYLDVKGGSSYNGAEIIQYKFHGDPNQQFQIKYENGFYKIYSKLGRCLDLSTASGANTNGTDLKLYDSSNTRQQQYFRFRKMSDGSVEIGTVSSYGNKIFEVTNSSYADSAVVQIWDRSDSRTNDNWILEPVKTTTPIVTGRPFNWPVPDSKGISAGFGDNRNHRAIDIAAPTGTSVKAAAAGTVQTYPGSWNGGAGNYVVITHKINGETYVTVYMHLSKITVANGATVSAGTEIGKVGSTGNSTGPHLDFSIRAGSFGGTRIDPGFYTNLPAGLYADLSGAKKYVDEINANRNNVYALSERKQSNY